MAAPIAAVLLLAELAIEELARELAAAWHGRSEISFGNAVGSIVAFFLCHAGVIALVHPVTVERPVVIFSLPLPGHTTVIVFGVMWTKRVPRWAGGVFVMLYAIFAIGGWLVQE